MNFPPMFSIVQFEGLLLWDSVSSVCHLCLNLPHCRTRARTKITLKRACDIIVVFAVLSSTGTKRLDRHLSISVVRKFGILHNYMYSHFHLLNISLTSNIIKAPIFFLNYINLQNMIFFCISHIQTQYFIFQLCLMHPFLFHTSIRIPWSFSWSLWMCIG